MPKYYLLVPQGCCVEITPTTDHECEGVYTWGMETCYHVAVIREGLSDHDMGHIFLCHADSLTDVSDENFGVPKWVQLAIASGPGVVQVYIGDSDALRNQNLKDRIYQSLDLCKVSRDKYKITEDAAEQEIAYTRSWEVIRDVHESIVAAELKGPFYEKISAIGSFISGINTNLPDDAPQLHRPLKILESESMTFLSCQAIIEQFPITEPKEINFWYKAIKKYAEEDPHRPESPQNQYYLAARQYCSLAPIAPNITFAPPPTSTADIVRLMGKKAARHKTQFSTRGGRLTGKASTSSTSTQPSQRLGTSSERGSAAAAEAYVVTPEYMRPAIRQPKSSHASRTSKATSTSTSKKTEAPQPK